MRSFAYGWLLLLGIGTLFATAETATSEAQAAPKPAPEMQRLLGALSGTWSITYQHESAGDTPARGTGQGEEVYRAGPGGLSIVEEVHAVESSGNVAGHGVAWWDQSAKGFRAIWCDNSSPNGCGVMAKLAEWQGLNFVLHDEWEADGKRMLFKEVVSDITPASFTQTIYQGEIGTELKKVMTIKATRATAAKAPAGKATQ